MLNKLVKVAICSGLVLCFATGCSTGTVPLDPIETPSYNRSYDYSPKLNYKVATPEPSVSPEPVKYTKEMNKSVKDYYSKYTYAVINQKIYNGVDINQPKLRAEYIITVDIKHKITKLIYKESDKVLIDTMHDYSSGDTYVKKDKKYVKKDGKYIILDWNLKGMNNIYDVYKYLLGDNMVKVNTEGSSDDTVYTFCMKFDKPDSKALSGVDFDKITSQSSLLVLKAKKKSYIPITNLVDITYTKDNYKYYCRTSFEFSDLSSKKRLVLG